MSNDRPNFASTVWPHVKSNVVAPIAQRVGRQNYLDRISSAIESDQRLIELVGTAGIGKTTIALAWARERGPNFLSDHAGGAWFADLSEVTSAEGMVRLVARVLAIPANGTDEDVLARVGYAITERGPMLLILDNFEQLDHGARRVLSEWLACAPEMHVLVTSRERLVIPGEFVIEVEPMEVPLDSKTLEKSESGQLLLARLQADLPHHEMTSEEREEVTKLLQSLEGVPLAIELASARMAFLGIENVCRGWHDKLLSLAGTQGGTRHGRQSGLAQAIGWSWELLSESERNVLMQCSIFRGGFDLAAAQAVIDQEAVADTLQTLHQKHLLRRELKKGGEPRFSLFHTIRQFAEHKSPENLVRAVQARHAKYYVELAEQLLAPNAGRDGWVAERILTRESSNLRAIVQREVQPILRATAALQLETIPLFASLAQYEEILNVALAAIGSEEEAIRCDLLLARAAHRRLIGSMTEALADLHDVEISATTRNDVRQKGRAAAEMGRILMVQGQLEAGRRELERAHALHREARDANALARTLASLGSAVSASGDLERAELIEREALSLHEKLGNLREQGMVLGYLANLAADRMRFAEAFTLLERAKELQTQMKDAFGLAFTISNMGIVAHRQKDLARARACYEEGITGFSRVGVPRYAAAFRGYLGLVERDSQNASRAEDLLRDACEGLAEVRDARFEALFRAHLAGHLAEQRQVAAARESIASANTLLGRETNDRFVEAAVRAEEALVEFFATRDSSGVRELLAQVRQGTRPLSHYGDVAFTLTFLERALASSTVPAKDPSAEFHLELDRRAMWFAVNGNERVNLERRPVLRRVLHALVQQFRREPTLSVDVGTLVATAWDGEKMTPAAAGNRVRVAVASLRKVGLGNSIEHDGRGYKLSAGTKIRLAEEAFD